MTDRELRHFFNNVMIRLGHHGWTLDIRQGHDSYCWINQKRIDLGRDYDGDPRQILLHEIAHIGTARFCNQKHNPQFWQQAEDLIRKWLKTGLDEHQLQHRQYASTGIYSLRYRYDSAIFRYPNRKNKFP